MNEKLEWYYAEGDNRVGPISDSQFESLIKSGKINSETLVWNKSFSDWRKLGNYQIKEESKPEREFVKEVEKKVEFKSEKPEVKAGEFKLLGIVIILFTIHSIYGYLFNIRMIFYIFNDIFRLNSPYIIFLSYRAKPFKLRFIVENAYESVDLKEKIVNLIKSVKK